MAKFNKRAALKFLQERDRAYAAWHEAAHVVCAATRGLRVRVWLTQKGKTTVEMRSWGGISQIYSFCGRKAVDSITAVAGIVGEMLMDHEKADEDTVIMAWEEGELEPSETDLKAIPKNWRGRRKAVREALKIIRRHRQLFDAIVKSLIDDPVLTDGMVDELVEQFAA